MIPVLGITVTIVNEKTFGFSSDVGILPALIEFMILNPEWKFKVRKLNNNGLTLI